MVPRADTQCIRGWNEIARGDKYVQVVWIRHADPPVQPETIRLGSGPFQAYLHRGRCDTEITRSLFQLTGFGGSVLRWPGQVGRENGRECGYFGPCERHRTVSALSCLRLDVRRCDAPK